MADYAIGDIQGCFDSFQKLLKKIHFSTDSDRLVLLGDLINRGNKSRKTLDFIYQHRDNIQIVLGNHDLHLLACAFGVVKPKDKDTISGILKNKQKDRWMEWLCQQPLVAHDKQRDYLFVHAGIPPLWTCKQALSYSNEVEHALQTKPEWLLNKLYGDKPDLWDANLAGAKRLRCIVNYCTRMRILDHEGRLNLSFKSSIDNIPDHYLPWFQHPNPQCNSTIFFGHWAALMGQTPDATQNVIAMDTGCVWGGPLSAINLDSKKMTSVLS